ncbi:clusterin [Alligator sinensis]|uniref:Clusterin n=1 Tax=Alligator sinensis TaxID=38654 RepID=A0A1U7SNW7_ALLSI|nr:clusterin [Alligator sinensis]
MALLLLSLLGLLLTWEGGQAVIPTSELKQLSVAGSKYLDTEIENAINGVKQMKTLMDKTSKDHQAILDTLEETKQQKEEAMRQARQKEQLLSETRDVCNETVLALWEECKPCLKQTCMRFYSKTCHSGSGLVGRQLEELLNHSSPFSIWVDGERVDSLLDEDKQQGRWLEDLEERYGLVEDSVDDLFQESTRAYGHLHPFFHSPFAGGFQEALRSPFRSPRLPSTRVVRDLPSPFFRLHDPTQSFQHLFQPLFEMTQRMFEGAQRAMENDRHWFGKGWDSLPGGVSTETYNTSDARMVCREIRRNSAGCLKMKDRCEKCKEILAVDCSDPAHSQLREQFEDALRIAERFSHRYDELLEAFQQEMLNTSRLLDQLNRQFGWVSRLANLTQNGSGRDDGFFQVTTVLSKTPDPRDPSLPADTQVTVQIFDSEPLVLTVPGDISWDDPKFMEVVADEALRLYKQNNVV